jgi:hypothetical protein
MAWWAAGSAAVLATALLGGVANCETQAAASPTPVMTYPSLPAAPSPGMDRYVDPVNGWSIGYPFGWRVDGSDPSFVQIHDPANQALVGIHVAPTDLPINAAVDQMLALGEESHRQSGLTWVVASRQLTSLPNGTPAIDVGVKIVPGGRSQQLYVVEGGKIFGVNAETYLPFWDTFSGDFDRILQSFTPPAPPPASPPAPPPASPRPPTG